MSARLPTGRAGQWAALAVTLAVLAAGFAAVSGLLGWQAAQAERLAQRQVLAQRMQAAADALPALQQAAAGPNAAAAPALIDGATDAIAAALLQERLQAMASQVGVSLTSAETLPPMQQGAYRRIGLHVAFEAPLPALVRLLQMIGQGPPRMLVDDLQLHGPHLMTPPPDPKLATGLTVLAFRAPSPAPARAPSP